MTVRELVRELLKYDSQKQVIIVDKRSGASYSTNKVRELWGIVEVTTK